MPSHYRVHGQENKLLLHRLERQRELEKVSNLPSARSACLLLQHTFFNSLQSVNPFLIHSIYLFLIAIGYLLNKIILSPSTTDQVLKGLSWFSFHGPDSFICASKCTCIPTYVEAIDPLYAAQDFSCELCDGGISAATSDKIDSPRLSWNILGVWRWGSYDSTAS